MHLQSFASFCFIAIQPCYAQLQAAENKVYVCPPCGCSQDDKTFSKHGICPACGMGLVPKTPPREVRNVGLVVFQGFEILDFAGPAEVFAAATDLHGHPFQAFTIGASDEEVESSGAVMMVRPEYTIAKHPKLDVVVIPGGNIGSIMSDEKMIDWIKARAKDTQIIMSVCNGAFFLHKAGLLDGIEATTHHGAIQHLRSTADKTKVVSDRRFVDSGRVITAAGVSAGIDAALHVVGRLNAPEVADNTARYMEYTPPKTGLSPSPLGRGQG